MISDGENPTGKLFQAGDGFFYGTTNQGGPWNSGVVYKVDVAGNFVLLHALSPLWPGDGSDSKSGVIQASETAPVAPVPLPHLFGLAFDPCTVTGGQSATGWVRLDGPAPLGGAIVTLSTSSSLVSVPATVTVPNRAWAASFTVSTGPVKKTKTATVTARYNGGSVSASLKITR